MSNLCKVQLIDTDGLSALLGRTPDPKRRGELLDRRSNLATGQTRLEKVFAGTAADGAFTDAIEEEVALIQTRIDEIDHELAELAHAEVVLRA